MARVLITTFDSPPTAVSPANAQAKHGQTLRRNLTLRRTKGFEHLWRDACAWYLTIFNMFYCICSYACAIWYSFGLCMNNILYIFNIKFKSVFRVGQIFKNVSCIFIYEGNM